MGWRVAGTLHGVAGMVRCEVGAGGEHGRRAGMPRSAAMVSLIQKNARFGAVVRSRVYSDSSLCTGRCGLGVAGAGAAICLGWEGGLQPWAFGSQFLEPYAIVCLVLKPRFWSVFKLQHPF